MGRRDLLLEALQEAAGRLGNATLALRRQRPTEAAALIKTAIQRINVVTTEMADAAERRQAEAD